MNHHSDGIVSTKVKDISSTTMSIGDRPPTSQATMVTSGQLIRNTRGAATTNSTQSTLSLYICCLLAHTLIFRFFLVRGVLKESVVHTNES